MLRPILFVPERRRRNCKQRPMHVYKADGNNYNYIMVTIDLETFTN